MRGEYIGGERLEEERKKENEKTTWTTKIILERHGEYYNQSSDSPDYKKLKEEGKLGLLTEKGIKETEGKASEKLGEILASDKPLDVIFLYSPSEYLDWVSDNEELDTGYGKRGKDTVKVTMDAIASGIKEKLNLKSGEKITDRFRITGIGQSEQLKEADIFYIFNTTAPKEYLNELKKKYGTFGWFESYYNTVKDLETLRKNNGAESPQQISDRIEDFVLKMGKVASIYRERIKEEEGQDRNLVIWTVTHQAGLRSFVQYGLKAPGEDTSGYQPKNNEMIDVDISSDNEMVTEFKGKKYKLT